MIIDILTCLPQGASVEENKVTKQNVPVTSEVVDAPRGVYLQLEINLVFVGLLVLALSTRLPNLDEPRYVV